MKKVLFIASTGGHLAEMMQLKSMFKNYDYYIITSRLYCDFIKLIIRFFRYSMNAL